MPRIKMLPDADLPARSREVLEQHVAAGGGVTNMKRTLPPSPVALRVLLEWYALRDEVQPFLGERLTVLFAHAVSVQSDCLICSTFFRRLIVDADEDPDALALDPWEQTIVEFGRQLARDANGVSDELFARLAARLTAEQ